MEIGIACAMFLAGYCMGTWSILKAPVRLYTLEKSIAQLAPQGTIVDRTEGEEARMDQARDSYSDNIEGLGR